MRKTLWILLSVLLVVASGAPTAHADEFTATFTCTVGCPPLTPPRVTNNPVTFPSPVLDITVLGTPGVMITNFPASFGSSDPYAWVVNVGEGLGTFTISDSVEPGDASAVFGAAQHLLEGEGGSLIFTAVTVPEPSSLVLMLFGIGFVFVMRKRIGRGLSRAS